MEVKEYYLDKVTGLLEELLKEQVECKRLLKQVLDTKGLNNTNSVPNQDKPVLNQDSPERVYKNYPVLQELLSIAPEKSKQFVSSIVNSDYPTMTVKQYEALSNLAKQLQFTKPLSQ